MSNTGLQRLKVWVQAKDLAVFVYQIVVPCFPPEEKWGLSIQVKRSASSIPANIAEGYGRYYYQSNIQFCYNARGSLAETISHVILASDLGYLPNDVYLEFIKKSEELTLMLNGYISYLKKSKIGLIETNQQIHQTQSEYEVTETFIGEIEQGS